MPVFKYLILNDSQIPEFIEVEQTLEEAVLTTHPLTGEPIERVPTNPNLCLNHSTQSRKKSCPLIICKKMDFPFWKKMIPIMGLLKLVVKTPISIN